MSRLEAREASKDTKYARYYPPTWVMRGAACSMLGEVGPGPPLGRPPGGTVSPGPR